MDWRTKNVEAYRPLIAEFENDIRRERQGSTVPEIMRQTCLSKGISVLCLIGMRRCLLFP